MQKNLSKVEKEKQTFENQNMAGNLLEFEK